MKKRNRKRPEGGSRPFLEELEPRLLLSADLQQGLFDAALVLQTDAQTAATAQVQVEALEAAQAIAAQPAAEPRQEIVFVDASIDGHDQVVQVLQAAQPAGRSLEIVQLDAQRDGVQQITEVLAQHHDLDAVHVVAQGDEDGLRLGNTSLGGDDVDAYKSSIASWHDALAPDADLLFHGIDFMAAVGGKELADSLAGLTGADVAARRDLPSSSPADARWDLLATGAVIDTSPLFDAEAHRGTEGSDGAAARSFALPLAFEQNQGQTDAQVDFLARGSGYGVFLTDGDAVLALDDGESGHVVRLDVLGGDPDASFSGLDPLASRSNYLLGDDASAWQTDVPNYGGVEYTNVYDGIDLRYYGNQRQLEYDFIVRAGADTDAIRLSFQGAQQLAIAGNGELVLTLDDAGRAVRFRAPVSFQDTDAGRVAVASRYTIDADGNVGFEVGPYDTTRTLIIDPVLSYGTYLGAVGTDSSQGIAVDAAGNAYIVGYTTSAGAFPTTVGPLGPASAQDIFVAKISSDGTSLVYSTLIGGTAADLGNAIAVDSAGNAYVVGTTASSDFPTSGGFQTTLRGGADSFFLKLNATGNALSYSTYFGGTNGTTNETAYAVAVDAGNIAYIAGATDSSNLPLRNPLDGTLGGTFDAYIAKFDATLSGAPSLLYSTYLGGSTSGGNESARGIAVDAVGNIYVTGHTSSGDFTTTAGAYDGTHSGNNDAYVVKLNAAGSALLYSSFLGAGTVGASEFGYAIDLDGSNNIYITGYTRDSAFPTTIGAYDTTHNGSDDAFVAKFDPSQFGAPSLVYSTFVGGSGSDRAYGIAVDSSGQAIVTGSTASANFPTTGDALQGALSGSTDAFVTVLNPTGSGLTYQSYLGGAGSETGSAVALDVSNAVFLTGQTSSGDFPATPGAYQTTNGGGTDGFVVKVTGVSGNQAPVNSAPSGQYTPLNTSLVFSPGNGNQISISDVDAGASAIEVTLTVANGTLTLGGTAGLTFTGGANGSATMTFTGTLAAINTALNGTTYAPTTNFRGLDTLQIVTDDQGNTGTGGAQIDSDTVDLYVGAVVVTNNNDLINGDTSSIDALAASDGGDGVSLREAITAANSGPPSLDYIIFSVAAGGPQTIAIGAAGLPLITDSVILDATTQPGYGGTPLITLDGSATPPSSGINGITLRASDSTVKGFIVINFADEGIEIDGSTGFGDDNTIQNNWVGLDSAGNVAGNAEHGIMISDSATGNLIGGTGPNEGNVTAGNGFSGLIINENSDNNVVEGNIIGLKADGTTPAGNGTHGIFIQLSSDDNRIGGTAAGAGNVISGNTQDGIYVDGTTDATFTTVSSGTLIQGNLIGTDLTGSLAVGNGDDGISLQGGTTGNIIGGTTAAARNVISANLGAGVYMTGGTTTGNVVYGNYVGIDAAGTTNLGNGGVGADSGVRFWNAGSNTVGGVGAGQGNVIAYSGRFGVEVGGSSSGIAIRGNSIFATAGIGIDLDGGIENVDLVTQNDAGDVDSGANQFQNYPVLTKASVTGSEITLAGYLDSAAGADFEIDFYANPAADPSGYGEGHTYLGSTTITTDANGRGVFHLTFNTAVAAGASVSATATAVSSASTSEFGAAYTTASSGAFLWISTEDDVPAPSGLNGLATEAVRGGDVLELGGPNLAFEPGVSNGDFSVVANFNEQVVPGNGRINALHRVGRDMVLAGGQSVQEGDVLLSFFSSETVVNSDTSTLAVDRGDVVLFRPDQAGNYSAGTFSILLDGSDLGFTSLIGLTLVERDTVVGVGGGATALVAGDFLLVNWHGGATPSAGADPQEIQLFRPTSLGTTTAGALSVLIDGVDLGMGAGDWFVGVDVVEVDASIGGANLQAGQILASVNSSVTLAGTPVQEHDVIVVDATVTGDATTATVSVLVEGADIGLNAWQEDIRGLSLVNSHPVAVVSGGTTVYTENTPPVVVDTAITISDANSADFAAGRLTVAITANGTADDRLAIRDQGAGVGNVSISGSNVSYDFGAGAVVVGTFSGGTDGATPLVVVFNANADPAAAEAVARNVTFANVSDGPSVANRTVQFTVRDGDGGSSTPQTKTVSVVAVNDAPAGADKTVITLEDAAYTFTAADFGFTDPSDVPANTLLAVTITTLPGAGTLTNNGIAVTAAQSISLADITSNKLVFTPVAEESGAGYASFTFQVQDTGGTANGGVDLDPTPNTITIDVTAVNDAPIRTAGSVNNLSVLEDSGLTSLGLGGLAFGPGGAADEAAQTLTYTVTAVPAASLGDVVLADGLTAVTPGSYSLAQIQGMQFRTAANANGGPATFSFDVQDSGGTANGGVDTRTESLTITVTSVNDAPVRTAGSVNNLSVLEDSGLTSLGLGALAFGPGGAADEAAQTFTYTVTSVPAASLGDVVLADGLTVVTPGSYSLAQIQGMQFRTAANANGGPATFSFDVQDSGGTANGGVDTRTESLTITVTSVNDAPIRTAGSVNNLSVLEDSGLTSLGLGGLAFGPGGAADEAAQTLTYTVTAVPAASLGDVVLADGLTVVTPGSYSLAQIQGMQFRTAANANGGPATFSFDVQDSGGTANGGVDTRTESLTITVTSVNDAPIRTAGSVNNLSVLEDSGLTSLGLGALAFGPGGAADEAAQTLTYTVTAVPAASLGDVVLADGLTAVTPGSYSLAQIQGMQFRTAANANGGPATFSFDVQDSGGTANGGVDTRTESLTITVTSVNDAPVRTAGSVNNLSVLEDSGLTSLGLGGLAFGPGGAADEAAQTLTYTVTAVPAASLGDVVLADGLTVVTPGSYTLAQIQGMQFRTAANANGGPATFSFDVQDSGGTANGGVDTRTESLTITVTSVNDAPIRTAGSVNNLSVLEDSGLTSLGLGGLAFGPGGAADEAAQTLTYTVTAVPAASLGDVVLADGLTVVTPGSYSLAQIQGMQFRTAANANGGPATFSFDVQDSGGTANGGVDTRTESLTITVTSVNDAPIRTAGSVNNLSVLEDSGLTSLGLGGLAFGPGGAADEAAQTLTYTVTAVPAASLGDVVLADGLTVVTPGSYSLAQIQGMQFRTAANANGGPATFSFDVQDSGGTANGGVDTRTESLTITVTSVNDAPIRTAGSVNNLSVLEDSGLTSLGLGGLAFGPGGAADEAAQTLTYTVTAVPAASLGDVVLADGLTVVTPGSYSLAQIQGMQFRTAANANGGPATFSFDVQDSGGTANGGVDTRTESLTITVTSVNDAPAGADRTVTTLEDTAYAFTAADFGFSDTSDSPANTLLAVTVTMLPGAGSLTNNGIAVTAGQSVSLADITASRLVFTPVANANGASYASFTFQVQDTGGTANGGVDLDPTPNTITIDVTAVNDGPANTVPGPQATSENTPLVFSTAGGNAIAVSDLDAVSLQVTLTATNGTLTLASTLGLAFSVGTGTGDATMTFTATIASINTAMHGLSYVPTLNYNGPASLTITTNDLGATGLGGALSDTDVVAITVSAINTAPVNTMPGLQVGSEDAVLVFSSAGGNAISISDVDAGSSPVRVTLTTGNGTLSLAGTAGLTFTTGTGTGDATMTFTGSIANINTALDGLQFLPSANYNGPAGISITTNDLGNTGSGGPLSVTNVAAISLSPVNDAPIYTLPNAQGALAETDLVFSSAKGNAITVSDIDAGASPVQVTLTATNGRLALGTASGLSFLAGSASGVATMTFTGTLASVNAALDGLRFTPNAGFDGAAGLDITVNDLGNTGAGPAYEARGGLTINVAAGTPDPTLFDPPPIVPPPPGPTGRPPTPGPTPDPILLVGPPGADEPPMLELGRGDLEQSFEVRLALPQAASMLSAPPMAASGADDDRRDDPLDSWTSRLAASVPFGSLPELSSLLDQMRAELRDGIADEMRQANIFVSTTEGVALVFSAGILAAIVRSGSLMAMVLSSLPLWRGFDPLVVLTLSDEERKQRDEELRKAREEEDRADTGIGELLDDD